MSDRFAYYSPVPQPDRDEDGLPCFNSHSLLAEVETPNALVCPVLYRWVMEAHMVKEVSEAFQAHETSCSLCRKKAA